MHFNATLIGKGDLLPGSASIHQVECPSPQKQQEHHGSAQQLSSLGDARCGSASPIGEQASHPNSTEETACPLPVSQCKLS